MLNEESSIEKLRWIMAQLRNPQTGCPWDLKQTFNSIIPFTIEEAYEVADAIEDGDMQEVKGELGDLLFQVIFYAQLAQEKNDFDFDEVVDAICQKLVRRHPHVFGGQDNLTEAQVNKNWEAIKHLERKAKGQDSSSSILANIPNGMAPLIRAMKLQKACAKVGFDWQQLAPVVDKVREEIDEVLEEVENTERNQAAIEEEIGDLLFAVVNFSRHVNVDAETALRKANRKFENRFRKVEQYFEEQQMPLKEATLDEMEAVWQKIKSV